MDKELSVAFRVKGHWIHEISDYKKKITYNEDEIRDKEAHLFDKWFIFTNVSRPKQTSKISYLDLTPDSTMFASRDPEISKAFDDLIANNQWDDDIATSLNLHKSFRQYEHYKAGNSTKDERKVFLWNRDIKTINSKKYDIDGVITPSSKEYDFFSKHYRVKGNKTMIVLSKDKKYLHLYEAFVIDEVVEIRKSKLRSDGSFVLYDLSGNRQEKLIEGNVREVQQSEEIDKAKKRIKNLEQEIIDSGRAEKGSSYQSSVPVGSNNSSGGGGIIIFVIILIIMIILIAANASK